MSSTEEGLQTVTSVGGLGLLLDPPSLSEPEPGPSPSPGAGPSPSPGAGPSPGGGVGGDVNVGGAVVVPFVESIKYYSSPPQQLPPLLLVVLG